MPDPPTPFPDSLKSLLPTHNDHTLRSDPPLRHPDCCLSLSPSLFQTLLHQLPIHSATDSLQQQPTTLLSIGSGSGLLERALQLGAINLGLHQPSNDERPEASEQDPDPEFSSPPIPEKPHDAVTDVTGTTKPTLRILGVEVSPAVNRYLSSSDMVLVPGTWAIAAEQIRRADVLMFVYPRAATVVRRCLDVFVKGFDRGKQRVKVVVLLLPVVDWEDELGRMVKDWADEVGVAVGVKKSWELGVMEEEMGVVLRIM